MTKTLFRFFFAAVLMMGLTTIVGCKKGENDPFLSLRSRKARISGTWKLMSGTITETQSTGGITNSSVITYTESTKEINIFVYSYSEVLTINKDGTFECVMVDDGQELTTRGYWFFSGKNKEADLKNKEAIVLSETESISTFFGTNINTSLYGDRILMIDRLTNKELVFKGMYTNEDSGGISESYAYDRTFEKQ